MNTRTRVGIGVLLAVIVVLLIGVFSLAQAQSTAGVQRWEYAIVAWNVTENTYIWNTSVLYAPDYGSEFQSVTDRSIIDNLWEVLDMSPDAGLVDYLAIMGLNDYELVTVSSPNIGLFIYYFKRPEGAQ